MNKKTILLILGIGTLAIGGVVLTVYLSKKKRDRDRLKRDDAANTKLLEEQQKLLDSQTSLSQTGDTITPIRDVTKAIQNNFKDIYGVKLYPAKKSSNNAEGQPNASGYTNVRSDAAVNTAQGLTWEHGYDFVDNLLGKVSAGEEIGTISAEKYDNMSPPIRWFLVKLKKPLRKNFFTWEYGWVRSDYTTFKPFKKGDKSSFNGGDYITKYDTSYQLGAEVFPHSNWMIPNDDYRVKAYDIDDVINDI